MVEGKREVREVALVRLFRTFTSSKESVARKTGRPLLGRGSTFGEIPACNHPGGRPSVFRAQSEERSRCQWKEVAVQLCSKIFLARDQFRKEMASFQEEMKEHRGNPEICVFLDRCKLPVSMR